jgi:hypothetical protein
VTNLSRTCFWSHWFRAGNQTLWTLLGGACL